MGGDDLFEAKFYGLGADGTVGANKNSVQIIGNNTNKYCQAYFSYDSKKSGGFTCSHLRFGDSPIHSAYQVNTPNFVACHVQAYLHMYDVTRGLRKNGSFLLNTIWEGEELAKNLPNKVKKYFAQNNITVYYINATQIAQEIGYLRQMQTHLQPGKRNHHKRRKEQKRQAADAISGNLRRQRNRYIRGKLSRNGGQTKKMALSCLKKCKSFGDLKK